MTRRTLLSRLGSLLALPLARKLPAPPLPEPMAPAALEALTAPLMPPSPLAVKTITYFSIKGKAEVTALARQVDYLGNGRARCVVTEPAWTAEEQARWTAENPPRV
jgi:hypothetical protein